MSQGREEPKRSPLIVSPARRFPGSYSLFPTLFPKPMLPDALAQKLEPHLGGAIEACAPVGGGCIANGCRLEAGGETRFLKWGDEEVARTFPGEAAGLSALREAGSDVTLPEVFAVAPAETGAPGFLLMEWIPSGRRGQDFWETFGRALAGLHRHTGERYGFERDNFIGRLPQRNASERRWPAFFQQHRLAPQVERARENGRWSERWDAPLDALYGRLLDLLPKRPEASVLHGDLWSGNFMTTALGQPALIDPAAYYGHREADLALTELFGGFEKGFYAAYREAWPLEPGYDQRRDVYNLYHLINHLNHFGRGYAGQVEAVLRAFA